MAEGELFIVSAPSGAGKTSLVDALIRENDSLCVSVSHTTRSKRPKEQDGINYHFIERARFQSMLAAGDFLESAVVYGHHYGTSKKWVAQQLEEGLSVILEIDWQGAAQVRAQFPQSCYIFIVPPSLEALTDRLRKRAQDDDAIIASVWKRPGTSCSTSQTPIFWWSMRTLRPHWRKCALSSRPRVSGWKRSRPGYGRCWQV